MSDSYIYFVLLSPVWLFFVLILIAIIKKQNETDQFFVFKRPLSLDTITKKVEFLELINKKNYVTEKRNIKRFFADQWITSGELEVIKSIIISRYFNNFNDRWIALKKSPYLLKILFFTVFFDSFFSFGYFIYINTYSYTTGPNWWAVILTPLLFFILPLLLSLLFFSFLSIFVTLLTILFPKNGRLIRIGISLEELIKSLKPGGRNTKIILPSGPWDGDDSIDFDDF